jgi:ribose-phosphate pyrophosphokinase
MKTFPLLFSTGSNQELVSYILRRGVVREGQAEFSTFKDGEISFELLENVHGKHTIVLGSTFSPTDNLIKLFMAINTLKIHGAASITVIIPYWGYCKSDSEDSTKLPLNSKLFAEFIEQAGATFVITLDLHSKKNENYFHIPLRNLTAIDLAAVHFEKLNMNQVVAAAPDLGGVPNATIFNQQLNLGDVIILEKIRPNDESAEIVKITGEPKGKKVIIIDDLIQTGGTLIAAANAVKKLEATEVYVFATHVDWIAGGIANMANANLFKEVVITDSIPKPDEIELPEGFTILPIADVIVSAIKLI